ncbi:MAG: response regulator [Candidatus Margulisiibacteriota bacterium]|nr:response regulator [Candidatus Margulisiibacteriota bacterium]
MKVLIADDEEILRISLEGILKSSGKELEIDFAINGEEACQKAKSSKYDIILLDLNMPKKDGYEVLKEVRSANITTPIIFITATGEPKKVMESIAHYKLSGFIEKPFTTEKVLDIVNKAVGNK